MIKKINIENMGSFKNFKWDSSVRDKGGSIVVLKPVNIFYGRNYSGKTTLSRILRAVETKAVPAKYSDARFSLWLSETEEISQDSLTTYDKSVRVFNRDFVKDNLSFVYDDDGDIEPFAIMGQENAQIEAQIATLENELGSEENKTGLYGELGRLYGEWQKKLKAYNTANNELDSKLKNKAQNMKDRNAKFGDVIYNITKIKADIEEVKKTSYSSITTDEKNQFEKLIEEKTKSQITHPQTPNLNFANLAQHAKLLVEKEITATKTIQELLENPKLQEWVHQGLGLHNKRENCAFCRQPMSKEIWDELHNHFNRESEKLKDDITNLISSIENTEKDVLGYCEAFDKANYYLVFHPQLEEALKKYKEVSEKCGEKLNVLITQLKKRQNGIFEKLTFEMPELDMSLLSNAVDELRNTIDASNDYTSKLSGEQEKAKKLLRHNEVYNFITTPDYVKKETDIANRDEHRVTSERVWKEKKNIVDDKKKEIGHLKSQLKGAPGTNKINELLRVHFGQESLSLEPDKNESNQNEDAHKFVVKRGDELAHNLSEGERNIIAFCYFIARLNEDTAEKNPIIWIDDPISSLDSNHIFFVYSIIDAEIVKPKRYEQIFIATHNLDFLKYLKRLTDEREKICEYFLIYLKQKTSTISVMPAYLKKHATEFNYLFGQIHKCANASEVNENNYQDFLNFGNNARKFLELFLYFLYPSGNKHENKIKKFFGEESQIAKSLVTRIGHERSHLEGGMERASQPIDAKYEEFKNAAQQILAKIEEHDEEQYIELVKSIDGEIKNHET